MTTQTTNNERTITVGKLTAILRTTNRRTLSLGITDAGTVLVTAPHGTQDETAVQLIKQRRDWIYRQLKHHHETRPVRPTRNLIDGEPFLLFGTPHRLRLSDPRGQGPDITPYSSPRSGPWLLVRRELAADPARARQALINWYAQQGQKWLDTYGVEIIRYTHVTNVRLRTSTRTTTLTTYHPRKELVLHWSAAQLNHHTLQTLVSDALHLPRIGDIRQVARACRTLWLGDLQAPDRLREPLPRARQRHVGSPHD
uniref:M48 family metallopeptidase n=1 Tax=Streptomyces sp. NBC_00003 TaxID=2903608 RepID=A0AAU2V7B2_9ACTN